MSDSIYIIVVTYNGEKWIQTFAPAFGALPEKWKVIVVDNASSDDTVAVLQKDYPHFELHQSKVNLGFGRANNIGLKRALEDNVDFAFLLNQDACISIEDLKRLMAEHSNHPECLVVSPMQYNLDFSEIHSAFVNFCEPACTPGFLADILNGRLQDIYYTKMVGAAAWLISKKCLNTIGGFNPAFLLYYEDNDYANRILYHGYSIGIVTSAKAGHRDGDRHDIPDQRFMARLAEYTNPSLKGRPFRLFRYFIKALVRGLRPQRRSRARQLGKHMLYAYKNGYLSRKTIENFKKESPVFLD